MESQEDEFIWISIYESSDLVKPISDADFSKTGIMDEYEALVSFVWTEIAHSQI